MWRCDQCGADVADGDLFCGVCGKKQPPAAGDGSAGAARTAVTGAAVCPQCGAAVTPSMRFCEQCGAALQSSGNEPSSDGQAPVPVAVDHAQGVEGDQGDSNNVNGGVQSGGVVPGVMPPAMPNLTESGSASSSYPPLEGFAVDDAAVGAPGSVPVEAPGGGRKRWPIVVVAVVSIIAVALIAAGVWWFVIRPAGNASGTSHPQPVSAQSAGAAKPHAGKNRTSAPKVASCSTPPSAQLASTAHEGDTLVAVLDLDTNCDNSNARFNRADVRVSIRDQDGVAAAAVFDFSKHPIDFKDGTASLHLAYGLSQYWSPYDRIDPSGSDVVFQAGEAGNGGDVQAPGGAIGGSNVRDSDIERNAQIALQSQISHDSSAASDLYDKYTTQLSSKKYGLQAEGKTWHYRDIESQYLQMRLKHPNALLIWAATYSNYTEDGNPADYYVVLSGESLDSVDAANGWCSSNGYSSKDCIAVQLR
ncbi:zinc ribbon domain-containing protein [Bifidobacterium mongoliense]|uniref:Double zinc ribbon n=1 Tax=Bifidobacterium mongoliense TaxID=518643 RepID=A0A423UCJ4_9BIFI|nr:zinc ribbon domain-containing protein [Bifidobacterium mongoliense]ROT86415.1 Double zinc ribbon [Bifidobacterium mongoliense]